MKKLLALLAVLCILSGCFSVPKPTSSTITYNHTQEKAKPEPKPEPEPEDPDPEDRTEPIVRKENFFESPIFILTAIGAGCMVIGLAGATSEGGDDAKYFIVTSAGIGLSFWVAAGIVALVED